ncbi:MAG: hypothetical protein LBT14_01470 [Treponema sp.]|nr:hypothetical protein [Treponema sp.]
MSRFYAKTPVRFFSILKQRIETLQSNPYQYPVYLENPAYRKLVVSS